MNQKRKSYIWLPVIIALAVVGGICIGTYLAKNTGSSTLFSGNKLDALIDIINRQYVDTINQTKLIEDAMPKILSELDPHSVYIPARDLEATNEELEGSFSGIGVQFNILNDTVMIVAVISGGPSEKAGLLPGDRIVNINDSAFVGKVVTNELVMKKLRGKKNSVVKLGISRATAHKILSFDIKRGDIPVKSVDVSYKIDKNIGYIRISQFGRTTYEEFINALAKLKQQGATQFIIDLRGNTGGYMDAAINMVNEFLPAEKLIVYTEGKAYKRNEAISNGTGAFQNSPIVVLLDEWSASASEIFAGAIQDNDRGTIVGRRSFGKGLVQQQIPFSDGSAIRLTIARYYTPSGRSIQKGYKLGENDDYSLDLLNRFKHGEFDTKDSIKMNEALKYHTANGRIVYGGGGIMPDIFVPRDTIGITSYLNAVVNSGVIYKYALVYANDNRKKLSTFDNYNDMLAYLTAQPLLNNFVCYAEKQGIKRRPVYIEISKRIIENQLQSYIARNILGDEAFYQIFQRDDKTLIRAINVLEKGESFPQAPSKLTNKK